MDMRELFPYWWMGGWIGGVTRIKFTCGSGFLLAVRPRFPKKRRCFHVCFSHALNLHLCSVRLICISVLLASCRYSFFEHEARVEFSLILGQIWISLLMFCLIPFWSRTPPVNISNTIDFTIDVHSFTHKRNIIFIISMICFATSLGIDLLMSCG